MGYNVIRFDNDDVFKDHIKIATQIYARVFQLMCAQGKDDF